MIGVYNAETVDIEVDGDVKNVIDELKAFAGQCVRILQREEKKQIWTGLKSEICSDWK